MQKNQWLIIGFVFLALIMVFVWKDLTQTDFCEGTTGLFDKIELTPITIDSILRCSVIEELYNPFIYLAISLWLICWINAGFEWWNEKKHKR
mgnify:CR=1 FL=1